MLRSPIRGFLSTRLQKRLVVSSVACVFVTIATGASPPGVDVTVNNDATEPVPVTLQPGAKIGLEPGVDAIPVVVEHGTVTAQAPGVPTRFFCGGNSYVGPGPQYTSYFTADDCYGDGYHGYDVALKPGETFFIDYVGVSADCGENVSQVTVSIGKGIPGQNSIPVGNLDCSVIPLANLGVRMEGVFLVGGSDSPESIAGVVRMNANGKSISGVGFTIFGRMVEPPE